jgi:hypothetical protein
MDDGCSVAYSAMHDAIWSWHLGTDDSLESSSTRSDLGIWIVQRELNVAIGVRGLDIKRLCQQLHAQIDRRQRTTTSQLRDGLWREAIDLDRQRVGLGQCRIVDLNQCRGRRLLL